ncbi:two-component system sensor histidine kinase NtrB [Desulfospira joergensenii]|uniref:two-component system sensor histidine kinase NtrB n=1 Tax=Desulfospira joergensenii TaxID=53329 RepID=UPI0003B75807|nr:ATP-binding protein [Desulfospira joergensenii]
MKFKNKIPGMISPFMMAGVLAVLLPIFVFVTLDRIERQRVHVRERLLAKGSSLIRTFEAGTRTGMLSMGWGLRRIQAMLLETSFQPEISYIMITTKTGEILAHSDASMKGKIFGAMPDLKPLNEDILSFSSRIRNQGDEQVFEVYKRFTPLRGRFRGRHPRPWYRIGRMRHHFFSPDKPEPPEEDPAGSEPGTYGKVPDQPGFSEAEEHYIFAGLSMEQANIIQKELVRHTIGIGILLFCLGGLGVIGLMVFQAYRSAKASLTRVQAFSDNVVQNMPSGLVTIDRENQITSMNRAARQILGRDLTAPFPQMIDLAGEMASLNRPVSREFNLSGEGDLRLDMTGSPILDRDGDLKGFLFLFRDLTQIRALQREVETTRRLAAIGKLAAGVAHEIRNPLSSIKGFATYFMKRYEKEPRDVETANIMVQEVERINRTITQLLEFAKPLAVEKKDVDIHDLISHSLRLADHDFGRKSIITHVEMETKQTLFHTDPDRLNQVLLNLYMNAVNAMDKGGRLAIRVSDGPGGTGLKIRVSDNGCGMDPETLDNIFDPYFTTRSRGTGLGLSIVHRIVENLGGDIRVESEPGQGTDFILFFPWDIPEARTDR